MIIEFNSLEGPQKLARFVCGATRAPVCSFVGSIILEEEEEEGDDKDASQFNYGSGRPAGWLVHNSSWAADCARYVRASAGPAHGPLNLIMIESAIRSNQ